MKLFKLFIVCFTSLISVQTYAQVFDFNQNCLRAYQNIIALKIDSGNYYLELEKKANPDNKIPILLYNYIDFLNIYTSGSTNIYRAKKSEFSSRISELKNTDTKSPYYLYIQAEIHTHAAVLHIKFGEYWSTVFEVRKALKKLEANQKAFPDFIPNYKSLGMLYTILGSIPKQYQGGLEFIGLKGEVNQGLALLEKSVNNKNHPFQHEAATVYAFMMLHIQNDAKKAWSILKNNQFNPKQNLMDAYSFGHIGIYGLHNDEGITALLDRPRSSKYLPFPLTDFLLGIGKTQRQDADANVFFNLFLDKNKGEDYIKSAWHKMAWNELIKENSEKYNEYLNNVKAEGRSVIDADKQALKELEKGQAPNPILLKARLLADGNYLKKALQLLENKNVNHFESNEDKTEFFYRLARIYDKDKQQDKAIQYYEITIGNGQSIPFYYAANSAYLLGFLYEEVKNRTDALKYYQLCLNLNGHEYQNSIRQKAEAGLNRIKNK